MVTRQLFNADSHRPLIIAGALIVVLILTVFGGYRYGAQSGWWGQSTRLKALAEDPIVGELVADHTRLSFEIPEAAGPLAKSKPEVVSACYSLEGSSAPQVHDDLVRAAQARGFQIDQAASDSQITVLKRQGGSAEQKTTLVIDEHPLDAPGGITEPCVSVRIFHS